MLDRFFYWLLSMSVIASFTGVLALLIGKIKKLPRRFCVILWAVPFLRMLVPVGINSEYSLLSLLSRLSFLFGKTVNVFRVSEYLEFSARNMIQAVVFYAPFTYKVQSLKRVFGVAGGVWLTVALALLLAFALLYFGTLRELRDARRVQGNVFVSEKMQSPAVYGVFRPKIVLPAAFGEKEPEYVLLHENAHIRRKDNLWRLLAFFAAAVHWFNPLSWLFLKSFLAQLELACDESVVSSLSAERRREYARTLLSFAESKSLFASAFGGAKVRTRIENVVSYKRMSLLAALGAAAFIAAVLFALLTN